MTHGKATSPQTQESCRDDAKDEGWDQKDESGSNAHPPRGGERFAGAARGRKVGCSRALTAAHGLPAWVARSRFPFARFSHYFHILNRTLQLFDSIKTCTQGWPAPGHGW